METKHTPGPWKIELCDSTFIKGEKDEIHIHGFRNGESECVCMVAKFLDDKAGLENNNARLIAATPDLLDALRETLTVTYQAWINCTPPSERDDSHKWDAIRKAEAAIAKAEGHEATDKERCKMCEQEVVPMCGRCDIPKGQRS